MRAYSSSPQREVAGDAREIAVGLNDEDVMRAYVAGPCDTLIITFGSATLQAPVGQFEFVGALRQLGHELGEACTHALFLKEASPRWYHPFAPVLDLVRREIASLRPRRVGVCGCSMGGYFRGYRSTKNS